MLVAEGESDQDEADISRLQGSRFASFRDFVQRNRLSALLESRNMPMPALLNGLGPRLQQMLHRPPTSGASKWPNYLTTS